MVKRRAYLKSKEDLDEIIVKICNKQKNFTIEKIKNDEYIVTLYDNYEETLERLDEAITKDIKSQQIVIGSNVPINKKENQQLIFSKKKNENKVLIMTTQ